MYRNIEIKPIGTKDTEKIIKWRNSEIVMNNFIDRNKLTKEIHENWLEKQVNRKHVYQFIANDKDANIDFGSTYLKDINSIHKKAEFGIFIGEKEYVGKGYGTIITRLTLDFGFNKIGLNKIYARVLDYNKASYNMFVKLGFHQDAKLREDVFIKNKAYDVYIMSILKNEWLLNKKD